MPQREDARAILRALRRAPVALARLARRRFKLTFVVDRPLLYRIAGIRPPRRSTWKVDRER